MKGIFSVFIAVIAAILLVIVPILVFDNERSSEPDKIDETGDEPNDSPPVNYNYTVVNTFSHDVNAFCQGFVFHDGVFFESTGLYGSSDIRKVDMDTGNILMQYNLSDEYFGEGMTIFGDRIIQLTWKKQIGFVYDLETFERKDEFYYTTEGWGLTHDGARLIMSDGSSILTFLDPDSFEVLGTVKVTAGGEAVNQLNELEYVDGKILANIWKSDSIAVISPETGNVTGWIDLSDLPVGKGATPADVLNGIAYDDVGDRLFVTGKKWPWVFEIELDPHGF